MNDSTNRGGAIEPGQTMRSTARMRLLASNVAGTLTDRGAVTGEVLSDEALTDFLRGEADAEPIGDRVRLRLLRGVLDRISQAEDEVRSRSLHSAAAIRSELVREIERELGAALKRFDLEDADRNTQLELIKPG